MKDNSTMYFPHGRPDASARLAVVDRREQDKDYFAHTNEGVCLLLEMAITGEFPDVTFGDQECELWSSMRRVLRLHGIEV